jgi:hypothetical protein
MSVYGYCRVSTLRQADLARGRGGRPEGEDGVMRRACAATVGLVLAASPALADEPLICTTSFQGYRVCTGPGAGTGRRNGSGRAGPWARTARGAIGPRRRGGTATSQRLSRGDDRPGVILRGP